MMEGNFFYVFLIFNIAHFFVLTYCGYCVILQLLYVVLIKKVYSGNPHVL